MTRSRAGVSAAENLPPTDSLACCSIDVEEYFHAEVFASRVPPDVRRDLPRRSQAPLEQLFELLREGRSKATLFVLGEVVDSLRSTLQSFIRAGHEIACHGDAHVHITRQTPEQFRQDVHRARSRIEDALAVSVRGYRAPTFSIGRRTQWALDVLIDEGFSYDASIFPIRHDRYGVPDAPDRPFRALAPSGRALTSFPPLTISVGGIRLPVGGGGYLRLLPGAVVTAAFKGAAAARRPAMLYVHPWELDPGQPRLPAGLLATWRHRVGMTGVVRKLRRLLAAVRFDTARAVLARVQSSSELPTFAMTGAASLLPATSDTK